MVLSYRSERRMKTIERYVLWPAHDAGGTLPPIDVLPPSSPGAGTWRGRAGAGGRGLRPRAAAVARRLGFRLQARPRLPAPLACPPPTPSARCPIRRATRLIAPRSCHPPHADPAHCNAATVPRTEADRDQRVGSSQKRHRLRSRARRQPRPCQATIVGRCPRVRGRAAGGSSERAPTRPVAAHVPSELDASVTPEVLGVLRVVPERPATSGAPSPAAVGTAHRPRLSRLWRYADARTRPAEQRRPARSRRLTSSRR